MKAIQFNATIPRYLLGVTLGKLSHQFYWNGITCTDYKEIPEPELPGEEWVIIKTKLGGICGTDTSAITLKLNPYLTPLVSFPLVFGHENLGRIAKKGIGVSDWQIGDRVVADPNLWCIPRGFKDLCQFCARGEINRCERKTKGDISPGVITGTCRDTGGSWSPYFLAHKSQLYLVPDSISDENGLMIEPLTAALHCVLQNFPHDNEKVLIYGAGTVGLTTLAALRALGSEAEICVIGRYKYQEGAARKLGASKVILGDRKNSFYKEIADWSGGIMKQPLLGKTVFIGGVDKAFDCVGDQTSLDDVSRLTRSGGRVILTGAPGVIKNLNWSAIFFQELELKTANLSNHAEHYDGKIWEAFDLAIELMADGKIDLEWMVTHKFKLEDYKESLELALNKSRDKAIKIAFEFQE